MSDDEIKQINIKLTNKQRKKLQSIANKKTDGDISRLIRSIADFEICLIDRVK